MTFDIFELLDKSFTLFVAVIFILGILAIWKILKEHLPNLFKMGGDIVAVWLKFVDSIDGNSKAVEKNTEITDANYKHSEMVLRELQVVNQKFASHDANALDVKKNMEELIELIKDTDDKEEMLRLLKRIINKLEDSNDGY